jgi:hypothetical protein
MAALCQSPAGTAQRLSEAGFGHVRTTMATEGTGGTGATPRRPVQPTDDGHHVVIDGRRWRATDPAIPPEVAARLRKELMTARRAVGAALRAGDGEAERAARDEVQRVKVALGERGTPWWEQTLEQRATRWSG